MIKYPVLLLLLPFLGCTHYGQLNHMAKLPKKLSENSGIASFTKESVWLIEDNGNSDRIYKVGVNGKLVKDLEVKNAKNHDWEDLTSDKKGNLYIGDFGNNANDRTNLVIYKLPNPQIEPGKKIDAQRIAFQYPEQQKFPPKKDSLYYDAEAFFHFNKQLYIFTKNRSDPFTGDTFLYKVPDQVGSHTAKLLGKIKLCTKKETCRVTSADISPDGKTIVLLGYGKLWTLTDFDAANFFNGKVTEIDLGVRTQLESVCFTTNKTLLLTDEVRSKEGGNLYTYTLP